MFPLNTILAWNRNIIMNKKYGNNNIIIASRAYFLQTFIGIFRLVIQFCSAAFWKIQDYVMEEERVWRPQRFACFF
jgi:hypothetical protein